MSRPPAPTKRFFGLAVGAAVLFSIGTNIQSGWLLVLSSLLTGAAVAGYALSARMVRGIEVVRHAPAEAFQGAPVNVELQVANVGRGMKLSVVLEDDHLAPATVLVPTLRPGERVGLVSRRIAIRRGAQASAEIRVSSRAPLGVARATRVLDVAARTVVYPAIVPLDDAPIGGGAASTDPAARSQPRRGTGHEYLGIREYRTGDSMRHVHWASTARLGEVMVREFEQEQLRRVLVVVDTLADAEPGPALRIALSGGPRDPSSPPPRPDGVRPTDRPWRTPIDLCCAAAGSVALDAMRAGHPVRLAAARAGATEIVNGTEPARVLSWLAELTPGGGQPFASVASDVLADARDASVLLLCPAWRANGADHLRGVLAGMAAVSADVTLALVDPIGFEGRPGAEALTPDGVERLFASLAGDGIGVLRLDAGGDLSDVFDRSARRAG